MVTLGELKDRMSRLKDWSLEEDKIVKDVEFTNFKEAMEYVNEIAEIAEKIQHHPQIIIDYNRVKITSTTHNPVGLTMKDFDLAEEIDKLGK